MRVTAFTKAIKEAALKQPFTTLANGTNDEAANYCKKDGVFFENGCYPKGRGTRSDIKVFLNAAMSGADDLILAQEYPQEFAKYHKAAEKARTVAKRHSRKRKLKETFDEATLLDWQKIVLKKLHDQDDRKVTWVYDPDGGLGKSWLANYLVAQENAYLVEGGKRADIAYAYNYEKIVVFDFTRSQEEQVNYSTIESFKNGRIFSSKYESGLKLFEPAQVLCLSNFDPDRSKLSQDRWQVLQFEKEEPPRKRRRLNKPQLKRQLCEICGDPALCDCYTLG